MRTPFSRTRRVRNALLTPGSGIALLAVLALVVVFFILRAFFPGAIAMLARPLWGLGATFTGAGGSASGVFADRGTLVTERDELAREVATLREENAILTARADDLTRLLGGRTEATAGTLAGVLARPPVSPYDTLVIDQGEGSGIRVGQHVFGAGGMPLGTVESVAPETARVLLYSAPGRVTEGWVGEARTPVSLEGASLGAFRTSVPRESAVPVGSLVYLPGPGALPIGTVVRVDTDPQAPRALIHVRPIANPFSITWVTVAP